MNEASGIWTAHRRQFLKAAGACVAVPLIGATEVSPSLADMFISAFNSDEAAAIEDWVRRSLSPSGIERRGLNGWSNWLRQQHQRSGDLSLVSLESSKGNLRLHLGLAKAGLTRQVDLRLDRDDPQRIFDVRGALDPVAYPNTLSMQRRATLDERIRRRIAFAADHDGFSGSVRITARSGTIIHESHIGIADAEHARPITAATRFNLGSADKSFTAVLIGQLLESGSLQLQSRLSDILPDYPEPEIASQITIRHLLTHEAGLSEPPGGIRAYSHDPYERIADLVPVIAARPIDFVPGTRKAYSNEGYVLLGAVIERLTGRPFWDVLEERIYRPAGMVSSGHFTRIEAVSECATGYYQSRDDLFRLAPRISNLPELPWRGNSCGGGFSTTADIAAYFAALDSGKLLDPRLLDLFLQSTGEIYPGLGYGMGFMRQEVGGVTLVGHSGGGQMSGVGTSLRMAKEKGWSIAVLGNCDVQYSDALGRDVAGFVAEQI